MPSKSSTEGIYFVVRLPKCWRLISFPYGKNPEHDHFCYWETHVTAILSKAWAPQIFPHAGRDRLNYEQRLKSELDLYYDGFPRGRVTWRDDLERFTIFHGNNLKPSMKVSRRNIEMAFGIAGRADWEFDDHEQCTAYSAEAIGRILPVKASWKTVSVEDND